MNDYKKYLYNKNNIFVTQKDIADIFKRNKINYIPKNIKYYQIAFTHVSYTTNYFNKTKNYNSLFKKYLSNNNIEPDIEYNVELQDTSYDVLEFLGDSLVNMFISEYLYLRYSDQDEHFLSSLKRNIQSNTVLGRISKYLMLDKFILISKIEEIANARIDLEKKILGDVLESFIAATYIDSKCINICKRLFITAFENCIDISDIILEKDINKIKLLKDIPNVKLERIKRTPVNNKPYFTIIAKIDDEIYGIGTSHTLKAAEEEASKMALLVFNEN